MWTRVLNTTFTSFCFFFPGGRKNLLKEKSQHLVPLDSSGSPNVSSRRLTSDYPTCSVCVCVCVYTHIHIHSNPLSKKWFWEDTDDTPIYPSTRQHSVPRLHWSPVPITWSRGRVITLRFVYSAIMKPPSTNITDMEISIKMTNKQNERFSNLDLYLIPAFLPWLWRVVYLLF